MGPRTDWGDEEELGFLAERAWSGFPFGPVWEAERAEGKYPTGSRYPVEKHRCANRRMSSKNGSPAHLVTHENQVGGCFALKRSQ